MRLPVALLAAALSCAAPAAAQAPAADTARPFDAPDEPVARPPVVPFGDLRLRGDFVTGLPAGREDLERGRATLRAGLRWSPVGVLDVEASFRASIATDHNADERRNFDNETPDAFELDRAGVRWTPRAHWTLAAGALVLPLRLTGLVWDEDLRPVGVTMAGRLPVEALDALRVSAGVLAADRFPGDDGRLAAGQLAWLIRDGAPVAGEAAAAVLAFDGLERDPEEQLQRQNSVVTIPGEGPRLAETFTLLDLQLAARAPLAGRPTTLRLDYVVNLEASTPQDAARLRAAWGEARGLGALELGYAYQRIERDAVPGSFNSDDWWFHSATRGNSVWVALGLAEDAFLRVSGFDERRDDLEDHTRRLLIELVARRDAD